LEQIVETWEKTHVGTGKYACIIKADPGDTDLAMKQVQVLTDALTSPLRKELLAAYSGVLLSGMKECGYASEQDDNDFRKKLLACVDQTSLSDYGKEDIKEFLSGNPGSVFKLDMINRNLDFIKRADPASLQQFRSAFCCLSYNFKTGTMPTLCKK
jgi:hypothetical protein